VFCSFYFVFCWRRRSIHPNTFLDSNTVMTWWLKQQRQQQQQVHILEYVCFKLEYSSTCGMSFAMAKCPSQVCFWVQGNELCSKPLHPTCAPPPIRFHKSSVKSIFAKFSITASSLLLLILKKDQRLFEPQQRVGE
jgi:hypothetical protein